jgi:hypothetical protein
MYQLSLIKKWLIVFVFPGFPEILASFEYPVRKLISEDFPTFDRPINPNSGFSEAGHWLSEVLLRIYDAERIIMTDVPISGLCRAGLSFYK